MNPLDSRKETLQWLNDRHIPYDYFEHERAHTIDDCLKMPFIDKDVTICKNIVLCNRQQTRFYLLLLRPHTPFRTAVVSKALGSSRLSFAPEEILQSKLHLGSGSVSPFGLIFDSDQEIVLCCEKAVMDTPKIAFHPCDNAATLVFSQSVFWETVIQALAHPLVMIDLPK